MNLHWNRFSYLKYKIYVIKKASKFDLKHDQLITKVTILNFIDFESFKEFIGIFLVNYFIFLGYEALPFKFHWINPCFSY